MKVIDFDGPHQATNLEELNKILMKRHDTGVNSYWLSHESEAYPKLSLLVKGDLATLHYIPRENHAGYASLGNMPQLKEAQTIRFPTSDTPADDVVVLKKAVLPFLTALKAAQEFFYSKELPRSVTWTEL